MNLQRYAAALLLVFVPVPAWAKSPAAAPDNAISIYLDDQQQVQVEFARLPPSREVLARTGVLVWAEGGRDRWIALPSDQLPPAEEQRGPMTDRLAGVSRGDAVTGTDGLAMLTTSLDQLVGGELLRDVGDGGLVTPVHEQVHLSGKLTLRRLPNSSQPAYPRTQLTLRGRGGMSAEIELPEGQATIAWADLKNLPDAWVAGLPPGTYLLRGEGDLNVRFEVAAAETRVEVLKSARALEHLLGTGQHSLYLQVAVESLLPAEGVHAERYPADALDLLEAADETSLTAHLRNVHEQLAASLRGQQPAPNGTENSTGVEQIDLARRQIELGQWIAARETLEQIPLDSAPRTRALADLYMAVIFAESGPATADDAYAAFVTAIEGLPASEREYCYRAHNNFASFLLTQAQDAIYNQATRAASEAPLPILSGLRDWQMAHDQLQITRELSQQLAPHEAAAVRANFARLYSLLADYLFVLNSGLAAESQFIDGQQAASDEAGRLARSVTQAEGEQVDAASLAVAHEILARLAHRRGEGADCRQHADRALQLHLDRGALAGVESVHRILAVSLLRDAEAEDVAPDDTRAWTRQAQQHLKISAELSEFLRRRFPSDTIGLSRAGFFARRAYINEKLVGVLIEAGDVRSALLYAELAKARALQDYLASSGTAAHETPEIADSLESMLASWPRDVVALEYFLGADRAYVLLVDAAGIEAQVLVDAAGTPLEPQQLIAEVRLMLTSIDHTAKKLSSAIAAGRAADRRWQEQLHWMYQRLIPDSLRSRVANADTLLVVPHHVLHYLPFAALVSQPDTEELKFFQIPQPRYLIDDVGSIVHAPSLSAFQRLRQRSAQPLERVNGFGRSVFVGQPPLPGVENDLRSLRRILGTRVGEIAEGQATTEQALLALLEQPGALLVGTHGLNLPQAPLLSYLRCGSGEDGDGLLQAAEIYTAPTRAGLVILSACYSGLADQSPLQGDDLFGLQRALLQAGSATVVSGHWDVFDRTGTMLMENFLTELSGGKPVARALADAQRAFYAPERAKRGIYSHPYFWAVLSVTGSDLSRLAAE